LFNVDSFPLLNLIDLHMASVSNFVTRELDLVEYLPYLDLTNKLTDQSAPDLSQDAVEP
jgi:hypothetical protein